jgi:hypothetical protein
MSEKNEHPILFSAPMVRAILDGSKTLTRRIVKDEVVEGATACGCRYGTTGDRLWVRETFAKSPASDTYFYRATHTSSVLWKWKPSIYMPREASRITLEITGIRVERLQDISRGDCMAEGCPFPNIAMSQPNATDPKKWYSELWESINGKGSFAENPWVWVVSFKKI